METTAEMTLREKGMKYVKQYVLITLSISIMSVGVYFFKFPNNFVFGGVTGTAALVAKLTPMSASAFSSAANLVLLVVGLIFLGKEFAMTTGYATFVMSAELMAFEKICPLSGPLSDQPMLDLLFAIALPAIASALLFNVGASSGGTDIIASSWRNTPTSTASRSRCSSPTCSWSSRPASSSTCTRRSIPSWV